MSPDSQLDALGRSDVVEGRGADRLGPSQVERPALRGEVAGNVEQHASAHDALRGGMLDAEVR